MTILEQLDKVEREVAVLIRSFHAKIRYIEELEAQLEPTVINEIRQKLDEIPF